MTIIDLHIKKQESVTAHDFKSNFEKHSHHHYSTRRPPLPLSCHHSLLMSGVDVTPTAGDPRYEASSAGICNLSAHSYYYSYKKKLQLNRSKIIMPNPFPFLLPKSQSSPSAYPGTSDVEDSMWWKKDGMGDPIGDGNDNISIESKAGSCESRDDTTSDHSFFLKKSIDVRESSCDGDGGSISIDRDLDADQGVYGVPEAWDWDRQGRGDIERRWLAVRNRVRGSGSLLFDVSCRTKDISFSNTEVMVVSTTVLDHKCEECSWVMVRRIEIWLQLCKATSDGDVTSVATLLSVSANDRRFEIQHSHCGSLKAKFNVLAFRPWSLVCSDAATVRSALQKLSGRLEMGSGAAGILLSSALSDAMRLFSGGPLFVACARAFLNIVRIFMAHCNQEMPCQQKDDDGVPLLLLAAGGGPESYYHSHGYNHSGNDYTAESLRNSSQVLKDRETLLQALGDVKRGDACQHIWDVEDRLALIKLCLNDDDGATMQRRNHQQYARNRSLVLFSRCGDGDSAIHVACQYACVTILATLLSLWDDTRGLLSESSAAELRMNYGDSVVGVIRQVDGWTPLHVAVYCGLYDSVTLLMEYHGHLHVTQQDILGRNALHYACGATLPSLSTSKVSRRLYSSHHTHSNEASMLKICQTLLLKGGRHLLEACDTHGWTPLHYAVKTSKTPLSVIQLLIDASMTVPRVNNSMQWTPLHLLAVYGNRDSVSEVEDGCVLQSIISLFYNVGPSASASVLLMGDAQGRSPLYLCAEKGNYMMAKAFLKVSSNMGELNNVLYRRDDNGLVPLHAACLNNHLRLINLLVSNGASCLVKDYSGRSALDVVPNSSHTHTLAVSNSTKRCLTCDVIQFMVTAEAREKSGFLTSFIQLQQPSVSTSTPPRSEKKYNVDTVGADRDSSAEQVSDYVYSAMVTIMEYQRKESIEKIDSIVDSIETPPLDVEVDEDYEAETLVDDDAELSEPLDEIDDDEMPLSEIDRENQELESGSSLSDDYSYGASFDGSWSDSFSEQSIAEEDKIVDNVETQFEKAGLWEGDDDDHDNDASESYSRDVMSSVKMPFDVQVNVIDRNRRNSFPSFHTSARSFASILEFVSDDEDDSKETKEAGYYSRTSSASSLILDLSRSNSYSELFNPESVEQQPVDLERKSSALSLLYGFGRSASSKNITSVPSVGSIGYFSSSDDDEE